MRGGGFATDGIPAAPQEGEMMEYTIVVYENLKTLEDSVNDLMQDGWLPHGSLVVSPYSRYIQPMTRMDVLVWEAEQSAIAEKVVE